MWRIAATLILVATIVIVNGSTAANGQAPCGFVGGFSRLRDLVGAQKVGECLEDEHFNIENQNAEQRTSGGLMVWRKVDNFTAFTDGGTSWINGPNGLQSRPNSERFSWESDPVTAPRSASTSPPPAAPPAPITSPAAIASPVPVAQAAPPTATVPPTATIAPTASRTPTKTPNPVEIKIKEKPDEAETGNEAKFEVETSGKKGICTLLITYNNTDQASMGNADIEDGKCEWKFLIPTGTKLGKAKMQINVSGENGTATEEDEFTVKKGDTQHSGDISIGLEVREIPDEITTGDSVKLEIETDVGSKGSCDASIVWPKSQGSGTGESKKPDGSGKCSWTIVVPPSTQLTKGGESTITINVRGKKDAVRSVTKNYELKIK
jgi:hypothetical protein